MPHLATLLSLISIRLPSPMTMSDIRQVNAKMNMKIMTTYGATDPRVSVKMLCSRGMDSRPDPTSALMSA